MFAVTLEILFSRSLLVWDECWNVVGGVADRIVSTPRKNMGNWLLERVGRWISLIYRWGGIRLDEED